jgi:hypothetical protein
MPGIVILRTGSWLRLVRSVETVGSDESGLGTVW